MVVFINVISVFCFRDFFLEFVYRNICAWVVRRVARMFVLGACRISEEKGSRLRASVWEG